MVLVTSPTRGQGPGPERQQISLTSKRERRGSSNQGDGDQCPETGLGDEHDYPLVNYRNYGKSLFLLGKSTLNGHFQ